MGAQPCLMEIIKVYLHRSLYLHLHQAYLHGRHLLRLDMAGPKAFCLQVSILPSSKASSHRVLRHLQVLVLHLDLDHPLDKALRPECPQDSSSQDLEGLDSRERSGEHRISKTIINGSIRESSSCRHHIQDHKKLVFLTNEVSGYVQISRHIQ